jgi:hypothetical protein
VNRRTKIVLFSLAVSLLVLVTLSLTVVPELQAQGRQRTPTPNGPVTRGASSTLSAPGGAPVGTSIPTPSRTRDLAPNVPSDQKITVIVRHQDGSYEGFLMPWGQYQNFKSSVPSGDTVIDYVPPEPLRHLPPPPPPSRPTVASTVVPGPLASLTCTQNPAGLTLQVTEQPSKISSPPGLGAMRSFYIEGKGFVPGELVTVNIKGRPTAQGNQGSTSETVLADSTFATTVVAVVSQTKMPLDVFVVHRRGIACTTVTANQ